VENAGRAEARLIGADLAGLPAAVQAEGCTGPVVIIVGDVADDAAAGATQKSLPPA
jgi:siroheme synthase